MKVCVGEFEPFCVGEHVLDCKEELVPVCVDEPAASRKRAVVVEKEPVPKALGTVQAWVPDDVHDESLGVQQKIPRVMAKTTQT